MATLRSIMVPGAAIARVYKSGGIPGGFPQTPEDTLPYDEEFIINYEAGFKTEWLGKRLTLNGSVFYYDHDDIQAYAVVPSTLTPGQFAYRLTNVGDGYNVGGELEVVMQPDEHFRFGASLGYLKTRIDSSNLSTFTQEGLEIPFEGLEDLDYAPEWSGNLFASYQWNVTADISGKVGMDYNVRTDIKEGRSPVDRALLSIDGYGFANARISLDSVSGWNASIWSKNFFDEGYVTDADFDGVGDYYYAYGEARSFGLSLGYSW